MDTLQLEARLTELTRNISSLTGWLMRLTKGVERLASAVEGGGDATRDA